jgi:S1-C subfamily serine protease
VNATARWDVEIAALQYRRKLMSQHDLNLHHSGHSIPSNGKRGLTSAARCACNNLQNAGHRSAGASMKRTVVVLVAVVTLAAIPTTTADNANAPQEQNVPNACSFLGIQVRPITAPFAASLGMAEPYGAIFDQPEPDSPAARAGIQTGDVVTAINGLPLSSWSDFATTISKFAPGTTVHLTTWRNGQLIEVAVNLASSKCPATKTRPAST